MGVNDADIERTIDALLDSRGEGRTICPSEAARALAEDWRPLMEPVRRRAYAMADEGRLEVTQRGEVVDGRTARGAIRLDVLRPRRGFAFSANTRNETWPPGPVFHAQLGQADGPWRRSSRAAMRSCSASDAAAGSPVPLRPFQVARLNWYLPR
jgi:hypothetical protein